MRKFYLVLALLFFVLAKENTLACNGLQGEKKSCQAVHRQLLNSESGKISTKKLGGATTFRKRTNDNSSYKVVLLTNKGKVPLTPSTSYIGKNNQKIITQRISSFVTNPANDSLKVQQEEKWWGFAGVISLAIAVFPSLKSVLDKFA
jgi:hypothetical protein